MKSIKKWLFDLLENEDINNSKKLTFDILLSLVILVSIFLIFIENEIGELPTALDVVDYFINIFFTIELLMRFYVCSDIRSDIKIHGFRFAAQKKIKWFFKFNTLIDFLAVLPTLSFFRVFRTLRFIRILRLLKFYRTFKAFKELDRIVTILRGMREETRVVYIFLSFTLFLVIIISFSLYISEKSENDTFKSFGDSIWYSIQIIGFGDNSPNTVLGKVLVVALSILNITIFGFFISLIINKIQTIMEKIASGKIGKMKLNNHIVICGYTNSSKNVIEDLLEDHNYRNKIVLVTEKNIPDDLNGVIYVNEDFTKLETLKSVNISSAEYAIVFSEVKENDNMRDVDLRTVLTIFHIEKINPDVHTIAEINDEENSEIIKDKIEGDEILYKEKIDSRIIYNCIQHKNISPMIYELFGSFSNEKRLNETNLSELKIDKKIWLYSII